MNWTQADDDALSKLWRDGETARDIAAKLGGRSKNAVIGRANRLKLPSRRAQPRAAPAAVRPRTAKRPKPTKHKVNTGHLVEDNLNAPDVTHLVGLTELTKTTCKWPIGDPLEDGFGFCGKRSMANSPYCEIHKKRSVR